MAWKRGDRVWLLFPKGAVDQTDGVLPSLEDPHPHEMRDSEWVEMLQTNESTGGRTGGPYSGLAVAEWLLGGSATLHIHQKM